MKKYIILVFMFLLLVGCENVSNTPTKQVESFFNKYQILDREVLDDLDNVLLNEENLSEENKNKYRDVMKKQYKNLIYQIKEEEINADVATVTVEITVIDFSKILAEYQYNKENNPEIFFNNNGEYDAQIYYGKVIDEMSNAKDKITYTLDINLSKINDKWIIDKIDSDTEDKILGVYQY